MCRSGMLRRGSVLYRSSAPCSGGMLRCGGVLRCGCVLRCGSVLRRGSVCGSVRGVCCRSLCGVGCVCGCCVTGDRGCVGERSKWPSGWCRVCSGRVEDHLGRGGGHLRWISLSRTGYSRSGVIRDGAVFEPSSVWCYLLLFAPHLQSVHLT